MAHIRTALGDVDASALGTTNSHEHLLMRNGLILAKEPEFRLDSIECAIEEVRDFHRYGGRAIIETSPPGTGRDPDGLIAIFAPDGSSRRRLHGFPQTHLLPRFASALSIHRRGNRAAMG